MPKMNDRFHNCRIIGIVGDVSDEATVDLEPVQRKTFEVVEG